MDVFIDWLFILTLQYVCWEIINPTLDGGGHPVPLPIFFGSGAFQIDLRDPWLMENSYFVLTVDVLKPENQKGVPKKI